MTISDETIIQALRDENETLQWQLEAACKVLSHIGNAPDFDDALYANRKLTKEETEVLREVKYYTNSGVRAWRNIGMFLMLRNGRDRAQRELDILEKFDSESEDY